MLRAFQFHNIHVVGGESKYKYRAFQFHCNHVLGGQVNIYNK